MNIIMATPLPNKSMFEEKSSQSLSISGGQLSSGVQVAQAGRDLYQTQQINHGATEKELTSTDALELMAKLEEILRGSALPADQKDKAIKHLEAAKEETKEDEPDKEYAAKSLQKATKLLKETGETVDAGQGLWKKVEPIMQALLPWLGVVPHLFGL